MVPGFGDALGVAEVDDGVVGEDVFEDVVGEFDVVGFGFG